jgi:hypothetical protein
MTEEIARASRPVVPDADKTRPQMVPPAPVKPVADAKRADAAAAAPKKSVTINEAHVLEYLREFSAMFPPNTPRAKTDLAFSQVAVTQQLITSAQLRECLDMQSFMQEPVPPIGLLLARLGYLDEPKLKRLVEAQKKAIGPAPKPVRDGGTALPAPPAGPPPHYGRGHRPGHRGPSR